MMPQSPAMRPEDLDVTPWYLDDYPATDTSPGLAGGRSSYPSYLYADKDPTKPDRTSTRNSSIESEIPRSRIGPIPRKAYMDLKDAMALLDETCPNQEPSPSLTPRTPLTPYPRNKRARSKSSDNSSSYSNDRLSDRSFETPRPQEKDKKRPFLRKIGISKTEDKPLLAKLTPKIIGKPYLEKIGPSKAVERPFLDKIGSSKTLDKFIFDTPRNERKNVSKNHQIEKPREEEKEAEKVSLDTKKPEEKEWTEVLEEKRIVRMDKTNGSSVTSEKRRSGKGLLLKMYSFETEDLECTLQAKENRDPLRGSSLDDVLDSGPSSLPPLENVEDQSMKPILEKRPTSTAELLKCRVTTSNEIIFSATCLDSPRETNSWGNSPRRRLRSKRDAETPKTPSHRKSTQNSREVLRNDDSTPNSPMKRPISNVSPEREVVRGTLERNVFSPAKTRRQTFEDTLERKDEEKTIKQNQFERRGISSDNLLTKDTPPLSVVGERTIDDIGKTRETSSEDSLAVRRGGEYTKETFRQLQEKFRLHDVPTETYAAFKRRIKGATVQSIIDRAKLNVSEKDMKPTDATIAESKKANGEADGKVTETQDTGTVRSVLKKQDRIEHPSDQETDMNASLRRPKRRIFHEPSQETLDLLTELRKVKSLLKAPSWEKDIEFDKKPMRLPKRILLTDKEFCLSVERENSIRRSSRTITSLEKAEENVVEQKEKENEKEEKEEEPKVPGPALFEKRCLSLDYADDEKPQKSETRAISLASARNLPFEITEYSGMGLMYDSKSYSSDVFNSPSEEVNEKECSEDIEKEMSEKTNRNHCAEVDIAIPIDQKVSSPKGRVQIQSRTSDLYEIISPRSTPFRVKKRLGKISVEETVKPESFTLGSKVDCRSVITQKRTKCFPL